MLAVLEQASLDAQLAQNSALLAKADAAIAQARSTIITSQLPVEKWHDHLADPTVADAICDRVLHGAHRLKLKGPSRRKPEEKTE